MIDPSKIVDLTYDFDSKTIYWPNAKSFDWALPLKIPPQSIFYVVRLNPKIKRKTVPVENDKCSSLIWPRKEDLHGPGPWVRLLDVTNYSDVTLLSATLTIEERFSKAINTKQPHGGESSTSGAEVSRDLAEVAIPDWRPNEAKVIVLVNTSPMWADYVLKAKADVKVTGESDPSCLLVVRPHVTDLDVLPGLPLPSISSNLNWNQRF